MKFKFVQSDKNEIVAYASKRSTIINIIENICIQEDSVLLGYIDNKIKELNPNYIECFTTLDDKIYAIYGKEKYQVKLRLYELYEKFSDCFFYINQGCLANINLIDHFEANIGGALLIVFKSGYKDYVSRRQVKNVKERLGIRK